MQLHQYTHDLPLPQLNTIKLYPEPIRHISVSLSHPSLLLVTRQTYSQILSITHYGQKIFFDELVRLEQCEYLFMLSGIVTLVKSFEIKFLGEEWKGGKVFPYTGEMRSAQVIDGRLYTHHVTGETRVWDVEGATYQIVGVKNVPFHIQGTGVKGHSRHIEGQFTALYQAPEYLYLGDGQGCVHIYETKYLTSVSKIQKHQGPILSIIENNGVIYATGCDSKIVAIKELNGKFTVTSHARGQSHDVLSICLIDDGKTLVSGGLSTDLCYYSLVNQDFNGEYVNRPSMTSKRVVSADNKKRFLLVNQRKSLELWRYNVEEESTDFQLRFQSSGVIEESELDENGKWLGYSTIDELVILRVQKDLSFTKHMSFKPCKYIRFLGSKLKVLLYTTDGGIYLANLKTRKFKFIQSCNDVFLPSDFDFSYPNILIGSKVEERVIVVDMKQNKKHVFNGKYDFAQLYPTGVMITKSFHLQLYRIGEQGGKISLRVPLRRIRFGAIYPKSNVWVGCGDGMLMIVKHLFTRNDKYFEDRERVVKKKMTKKETTRIYQTFVSPTSLGLIPIDFKEMLQGIENPIIAKKVM